MKRATVLPIAQIEVLQSLAEAKPATAGELAQRLRLAPNTVSGLISRLIAADLVHRGTQAGDHRKAAVELTAAGAERLTAWQHAHELRIGAALDALGPEHRQALQQALPAMAALVRQLHLQVPPVDTAGHPQSAH